MCYEKPEPPARFPFRCLRLNAGTLSDRLVASRVLLLICAGLFECDLERGVPFISFVSFGAETLVFRCRAAPTFSDHWVYAASLAVFAELRVAAVLVLRSGLPGAAAFVAKIALGARSYLYLFTSPLRASSRDDIGVTRPGGSQSRGWR